MTHQGRRCWHCKTYYYYQSSGAGCGDAENDDRYCPACMAAINKALSGIDVKFHSEFLPVLPDLPRDAATMEEFEKKLDEKKLEDAKNPLHLDVRRVTWGTPGVIDDELVIRGVTYRRLVDTVTGDKLLTAEYEVTGPGQPSMPGNSPGEVTDVW